MSARSVYGPVQSRRFGMSLGIDPILNSSVCSFNCVYCQLGDIIEVTTKRRVFVPTVNIKNDFLLSPYNDVDVITLSGNGEPTLALNLGDILRTIKGITSNYLIVFTNGTLLNDNDVVSSLCEASEVSVKLDVINDIFLKNINRADSGVTLDSILNGIRGFRKKYQGVFSIQTMALPITEGFIEELSKMLISLAPDRVDINTPARCRPSTWNVDNRGAHGGIVMPGSQEIKKMSKEASSSLGNRLMDAGIKVFICPP